MKYFHADEFECCCGCGRNEIKTDFVLKLDRLREALKYPMLVVSGYRCPAHNMKVAKTGERGPHTTGRAADFRIDRSFAFEMVNLVKEHGFTGLGVQQKGAGRFIHLDDLENDIGQPRPTIWSY